MMEYISQGSAEGELSNPYNLITVSNHKIYLFIKHIAVPRVRDGEPLGVITLIAVGAGVLTACLLLILITAMVYKDRKSVSKDETTNEKQKPYFTNMVFGLDDECSSSPTKLQKKHSSNDPPRLVQTTV